MAWVYGRDMSNDLRSTAAEASNIRRQISELVRNIHETRMAGNGSRPELTARMHELRGQLVSAFGTGAAPSMWLRHDDCPATGIDPTGPIIKKPTTWTTRCPDCDRIVRVSMPRVNLGVHILRHAGKATRVLK